MFEPIAEDFLHFVWHNLNFKLNNLRTICGKELQIRKPGRWNHDQGPDFLYAHLYLDKLEWYGHVELHIHSKDWYRHKHHQDPYYNNTILHVVLESNSQPIIREDGTPIPELILANRISESLYHRYDQLRLNQQKIPCDFALPHLSEHHVYPWIERMLIERMQAKAMQMKERLILKTNNWEQILWEEIAAMMGGPVNQDAMRQLASELPYHTLKKHGNNLLQTEALLFGISGLLIENTPNESYYQSLRETWNFLKHKYQLKHSIIYFRYLRMRPAAFPSIRLAQIASLLTHFIPIISLIDQGNFENFLQASIQASNYWDTHFRLGATPSKKQIKRLGKSQKEVLIINTLLPFAIIYQSAHGNDEPHQMIENSLKNLSPEKNRHTKYFEELGIRNQNAMHSQGLIQLKKHYCDKKNCMRCGIGHQVLKGSNGIKGNSRSVKSDQKIFD